MTGTIQILLLLLAVLVAAALIARRLNTAPSIVLVIAGVVLALIPGLPRIELAPEFVLLVILPPLIYSAGVSMSWREFRFNLRPITLLAFGCVVFTACAVAAAAHYVLGFDGRSASCSARSWRRPTWWRRSRSRAGSGCRAGCWWCSKAKVSPTTRPRSSSTASRSSRSRPAMFSPMQAAGTFAAIVVGEIVWGIGVGWLSLHLRRWAREPRVEIVLSLMTPYVAYWVPEHLGGSGVLATVATGLYVSWNGPLLIPSATRLQGIFFWDLIIYVIEGFVFLLTGLQARTLIEQVADGFPLRDIAVAILVTTAIVIVARFVWVLSRDLSAALALAVLAQARPVAALAVSVRARLYRRARRRLARGRARDPADARERRSRFPTAT